MSQISNKFHKYTFCIYVCWGDMYRKRKRVNMNCWLNFTRSEILYKTLGLNSPRRQGQASHTVHLEHDVRTWTQSKYLPGPAGKVAVRSGPRNQGAAWGGAGGTSEGSDPARTQGQIISQSQQVPGR